MTTVAAKNDMGPIANLQRDLDARESEAAFQRRVVKLAIANGWEVYHTFDPRRSAFGYPDLTLARAGVHHHWELKSMTGKLSPAQLKWATALGGSWRCFRPADWEEIERTLRG